MINEKDIKKTAELARIKLDAKEEKDLTRDLENIVGYIGKLKEVNVSGVQEVAHVFHTNDFRKDEPPKKVFDPDPLVDAAPEKERGFVKVKKILDKE